MATPPKPDASASRLTKNGTVVHHDLANRHRPSGRLQFDLAMEVFARLVAASVFKTDGRQENLSLVGSIPIHFRHFSWLAFQLLVRRCQFKSNSVACRYGFESPLRIQVRFTSDNPNHY